MKKIFLLGFCMLLLIPSVLSYTANSSSYDISFFFGSGGQSDNITSKNISTGSGQSIIGNYSNIFDIGKGFYFLILDIRAPVITVTLHNFSYYTLTPKWIVEDYSTVTFINVSIRRLNDSSIVETVTTSDTTNYTFINLWGNVDLNISVFYNDTSGNIGMGSLVTSIPSIPKTTGRGGTSLSSTVDLCNVEIFPFEIDLSNLKPSQEFGIENKDDTNLFLYLNTSNPSLVLSKNYTELKYGESKLFAVTSRKNNITLEKIDIIVKYNGLTCNQLSIPVNIIEEIVKDEFDKLKWWEYVLIYADETKEDLGKPIIENVNILGIKSFNIYLYIVISIIGIIMFIFSFAFLDKETDWWWYIIITIGIIFVLFLLVKIISRIF